MKENIKYNFNTWFKGLRLLVDRSCHVNQRRSEVAFAGILCIISLFLFVNTSVSYDFNLNYSLFADKEAQKGIHQTLSNGISRLSAVKTCCTTEASWYCYITHQFLLSRTQRPNSSAWSACRNLFSQQRSKAFLPTFKSSHVQIRQKLDTRQKLWKVNLAQRNMSRARLHLNLGLFSEREVLLFTAD